jgi:hypothetical protein
MDRNLFDFKKDNDDDFTETTYQFTRSSEWKRTLLDMTGMTDAGVTTHTSTLNIACNMPDDVWGLIKRVQAMHIDEQIQAKKKVST